MTPTPTSKETIILNLKNGESFTYYKIEFLPISKQLLFNGENINIKINKDEVLNITISGQTFFISEIEILNNAKIVKLCK